jgi:hypothetical protein
MHKIPKQSNFHLGQIKLKADDTVIVIGVVVETDGEEVYENKLSDTYVFPPHKDFKDAIEKLKPTLARLSGLTDIATVIESKEFRATKQQLEAWNSYRVIKLYDVVVTGVSISGDRDDPQVVITGHYQGQAINTKRRKITSDLDFTDELKQMVDDIIDETYKYAFTAKRAKLEPLGADPEQLELEGEPEEEVISGKDAAAGDS